MTLFSGKYDVYGSRPDQINLAAQLEAQGVANHTVAGTISSIFIGGAVSLALGGGLDKLSTGISNVKNIFQTVFNNNDEEDYFAGLGGSAPVAEEHDVNDDIANAQLVNNIIKTYDLYDSSSGQNQTEYLAKLGDLYKTYIENGGTNTGTFGQVLEIVGEFVA